VSRKTKKNWDLCKEVNLWGISRLGKDRRIEPGDHLLFWVGGTGYVGYGTITEPPRPPNGREEAPWPGGKYHYGTVIPFRLVLEVADPYRLPFVAGVQESTGWTSARFQRGFASIDESTAQKVTRVLVERSLAEG
jgi:hypothetical protein